MYEEDNVLEIEADCGILVLRMGKLLVSSVLSNLRRLNSVLPKSVSTLNLRMSPYLETVFAGVISEGS